MLEPPSEKLALGTSSWPVCSSLAPTYEHRQDLKPLFGGRITKEVSGRPSSRRPYTHILVMSAHNRTAATSVLLATGLCPYAIRASDGDSDVLQLHTP